jgi:putative heme-binding domain-containing protein
MPSRLFRSTLCVTAIAFTVIVTGAEKEPIEYQGASEPTTKSEAYGEGVRESVWQSPQDEASGFHLPPGFVAELIASEPQIAKPLNMAFDHRGRLWVTCTVEYPYPAAEGSVPRDTIKILEDSDGDGTFESVKTFADELNIPIGLLPVQDGVICFSIPKLWLLKDIDGDDRVDQRIKLLGPFDTTRDTHGMVNSLRLGRDGWIYACHGFNNQSSVTASDGSRVEMNSGNTFRFLPDGSRIETYTIGQVNPFGMTCDEWGNWFSADCHSKPLTALIPGACYPSFGRPHDGLGFAPSMMDHLHGSTAICGLEYYQADIFPRAYQGLFYSGNVMTSRINVNQITRHGATLIANEQQDFMTSDDTWFRPVDILQGPEGALYIADFYNKIIGHYEVPLTHPERDRESGRIWRIRYTGNTKMEPHQTGQSVLGSKNFRARQMAIQAELITPSKSTDDLEKIVRDNDADLPLRQSALEILARRGQCSGRLLIELLRSGPPELAAQVLNVACGWTSLSDTSSPEFDTDAFLSATVQSLHHSHPEVVKAAANTLARFGTRQHLASLLVAALRTPDTDTVLRHAYRIAIRNILYRDDEQVRLFADAWKADPKSANSDEAAFLANVLPGVASSSAAYALLEYVALQTDNVNETLRSSAIEHASQHPDERLIDRLLTMVGQSTGEDLIRRAELLLQVTQAFPPNTKTDSKPLREFAQRTLFDLLEDVSQKVNSDGSSIQWMDQSGESWIHERRQCSDGETIELLSSLGRGEQYVGQLSSETFSCPESFSLWVAGHNGFPDKPDHQLNFVTLIDAKSGRQLMKSFPPRSDVAVEVTWDLQSYEGKNVVLRVVDGDNGSAFAWLGVARFSLPSLQSGLIDRPLESLTALLEQGFGDSGFVNQVVETPLSPSQRAGVIRSALQGRGSLLAATLAQQSISMGRADLVSMTLYDQTLTPSVALPMAQVLCQSATSSQQSTLARSLLSSQDGCELLAEVLRAGWINPAALRGASTLLPPTLAAEKKEQLQRSFDAAEAAGLDTTLVKTRLADLDWNQADPRSGQQLFEQHCANCHQLAGKGTIIGPQLDGAVQRSVERLAEDILLPNLNVDQAFRSTTFLLEDGSIKSGLIRKEDGQSIELVGNDSKTVSFLVSDIVERKQSEQSLMPANLGDFLNPQQLVDLLQFLNESAKK